MDEEYQKLLEYPLIKNSEYRPSSCIRMGFETGWTRDERYLMNKRRSDKIQAEGVEPSCP